MEVRDLCEGGRRFSAGNNPTNVIANGVSAPDSVPNNCDEFKARFKWFKSCDRDQLLVEDAFETEPVKLLANDGAANNSSRSTTVQEQVKDNRDGGSPGPGTELDSKLSVPFFGLTPPSTWKISKLKFPEGLIFISNPFTAEGQRYWISTCLKDYVNPPYITNISNLERNYSSEKRKKSPLTPKEQNSDFYKKLRWVTFGYHHNWDTKIYSEDNKCEFPKDLFDLTNYMATVLDFRGFKAEAAIVNYYNLDSTLSGHQDRSEENVKAPLFSISFGQTAIFLIGGETKEVRPVALHLKSGDVVIMAGKSRLSYHGVPKIVKTDGRPWQIFETRPNPHKRFKTADTSNSNMNPTAVQVEKCSNWESFVDDYAGRCRINLNVRQVLSPGHDRFSPKPHNR